MKNAFYSRATLIFIFLVGFAGSKINAVTLKKMAQASNFILVISDRFGTLQKASKKTCDLDQDTISQLSQKLKIEIDAKIMTLTENDFNLIKKRIQVCDVDCSCDIYALALEKKNIQIPALDLKINQMTSQKRESCVTINNLHCDSVYLKKLINQKL